MGVLRALWRGEPGALRRLHLALTVAWFAVAFPIMLTDLRNSIALLVFISVYANVAGHWSAWQASRAEEEATTD